MENKVHPQMVEFLEKLFPDRPGEETFNQISKHGKKTIEDIESLAKKKGIDYSPTPSTQHSLIKRRSKSNYEKA